MFTPLVDCSYTSTAFTLDRNQIDVVFGILITVEDSNG